MVEKHEILIALVSPHTSPNDGNHLPTHESVQSALDFNLQPILEPTNEIFTALYTTMVILQINMIYVLLKM